MEAAGAGKAREINLIASAVGSVFVAYIYLSFGEAEAIFLGGFAADQRLGTGYDIKQFRGDLALALAVELVP